jgi:ferredoxin-NADP reductase
MIAAINSIRNLSDRVKVFELHLPEAVGFIAGQFVIVKALINGESIERSYSIANQKAEKTNALELCVALNTAGMMTPYLFGLGTGAKLEISMPQGGFVLRDTSVDVPNLFVCTGTGVAPFRSMIAASLALNPNRHVHLVFGNRKVEDVLYHEHWLALREQNSNFHYYPVLSKGDEGLSALTNSNNFQKGYVHPIYEQLLSKDLGSHVYVCGWEVMCTESRERLKAMGLTRRQYFFEQYDG